MGCQYVMHTPSLQCQKVPRENERHNGFSLRVKPTLDVICLNSKKEGSSLLAAAVVVWQNPHILHNTPITAVCVPYLGSMHDTHHPLSDVGVLGIWMAVAKHWDGRWRFMYPHRSTV